MTQLEESKLRALVLRHNVELELFFSDVFDAFWKFEMNGLGENVNRMALDGLIGTTARIMCERCSIEDALESLDRAKDQFTT